MLGDSAPVLVEDKGRLLDTEPLGLRVEAVHGDGHEHAHARKEEEEAPAHRAQHGQVRLHAHRARSSVQQTWVCFDMSSMLLVLSS